jgi:hypothetical protein
MKRNETEYLDKLFASSSDVSDEAEVTFPLVDVPEGLSEKLYEIAESTPLSVAPKKRAALVSWPKVTSIAAALLVAVVSFQFYQQQQTLRQLTQAQADLATALHYLGEANRIARAQVRDSLNNNMKNAGVEPAIEFGREFVNPNLKDADPESNYSPRTL